MTAELTCRKSHDIRVDISLNMGDGSDVIDIGTANIADLLGGVQPTGGRWGVMGRSARVFRRDKKEDLREIVE